MRRNHREKRPVPIRSGQSGETEKGKTPSRDAMRDVRHVKAARELLRWDQQRLAAAASLSVVSVRRYEAARDPVAESIEQQILAALEGAGVLFVAEGEVDDAQVSGGVLLRTSARPEAPAAKRVLIYGATTLPGRPKGKEEASPRKPRADRKDPSAG